MVVAIRGLCRVFRGLRLAELEKSGFSGAICVACFICAGKFWSWATGEWFVDWGDGFAHPHALPKRPSVDRRGQSCTGAIVRYELSALRSRGSYPRRWVFVFCGAILFQGRETATSRPFSQRSLWFDLWFSVAASV